MSRCCSKSEPLRRPRRPETQWHGPKGRAPPQVGPVLESPTPGLDLFTFRDQNCPAFAVACRFDELVSPARTLQGPLDVDDTLVEVHVVPAQPEHLSLTQAEQANEVQGLPVITCDRLEEAPGLGQVQRSRALPGLLARAHWAAAFRTNGSAAAPIITARLLRLISFM